MQANMKFHNSSQVAPIIIASLYVLKMNTKELTEVVSRVVTI